MENKLLKQLILQLISIKDVVLTVEEDGAVGETHLCGQAEDEHGQTFHHRRVLVQQQREASQVPVLQQPGQFNTKPSASGHADPYL